MEENMQNLEEVEKLVDDLKAFVEENPDVVFEIPVEVSFEQEDKPEDKED